jgi:hypothetical protein
MFRQAVLFAIASALCSVGTSVEAQEGDDFFRLTFPPYKEATTNRSIAWGWWSENDRDWISHLESLYNMHLPVSGSIPQIEGPNKQSMSIKKIMHQVWLGGKPIPPQFAAWRKTCMDLHPDWMHILWTEKEADELDMLDRKAYDNAPNIGAKSDSLRSAH